MRVSLELDSWFKRNKIGYDEISEDRHRGLFIRTKDKEKVLNRIQKTNTLIQCKEIDNNFVKVFYK